MLESWWRVPIRALILAYVISHPILAQGVVRPALACKTTAGTISLGGLSGEVDILPNPSPETPWGQNLERNAQRDWVLWFRGEVFADGRGAPSFALIKQGIDSHQLPLGLAELETFLNTQPHHREAIQEILKREFGFLRAAVMRASSLDTPRSRPAIHETAGRIARLLDRALLDGYWPELDILKMEGDLLRLDVQPFRDLFRRHAQAITSRAQRGLGLVEGQMYVATCLHQAPPLPFEFLDWPLPMRQTYSQWPRMDLEALLEHAKRHNALNRAWLPFLRHRIRDCGLVDDIFIKPVRITKDAFIWATALSPAIEICLQESLQAELIDIIQDVKAIPQLKSLLPKILEALRKGNLHQLASDVSLMPSGGLSRLPTLELSERRTPWGVLVLIRPDSIRRDEWMAMLSEAGPLTKGSLPIGEEQELVRTLGIRGSGFHWVLFGESRKVVATGASLSDFLKVKRELKDHWPSRAAWNQKRMVQYPDEIATRLRALEDLKKSNLKARSELNAKEISSETLDSIWREWAHLAEVCLEDGLFDVDLGFDPHLLWVTDVRTIPSIAALQRRWVGRMEEKILLNPANEYLWSCWVSLSQTSRKPPSPGALLRRIMRPSTLPMAHQDIRIIQLSDILYAFKRSRDWRGLSEVGDLLWDYQEAREAIRKTSPTERARRPLPEGIDPSKILETAEGWIRTGQTGIARDRIKKLIDHGLPQSDVQQALQEARQVNNSEMVQFWSTFITR